MLIPYTMASASAAIVRHGKHWADIYQWNLPLHPVNYRVVLWRDNGINGPQQVDGFKSFNEAHTYASDRLQECV